jgi:hypothetical protein
MGKLTKWLAALYIGTLITGCNPVGPSNDKIRLDIEDAIKEQTKGIVLITNLETRRERLSEDRVRVEMRITYKADPEELRKASSAVEILRTKPFGAAASFDLARAVDRAKSVDGKIEDLTAIYRLRGNGVWNIAQTYSGHGKH